MTKNTSFISIFLLCLISFAVRAESEFVFDQILPHLSFEAGKVLNEWHSFVSSSSPMPQKSNSFRSSPIQLTDAIEQVFSVKFTEGSCGSSGRSVRIGAGLPANVCENGVNSTTDLEISGYFAVTKDEDFFYLNFSSYFGWDCVPSSYITSFSVNVSNACRDIHFPPRPPTQALEENMETEDVSRILTGNDFDIPPTLPPAVSTFGPIEIPTFPPALPPIPPSLPPSPLIPSFSFGFSLDESSTPYDEPPFGKGVVGLLYSTAEDCAANTFSSYAFLADGCHPLKKPHHPHPNGTHHHHNRSKFEEINFFEISCDDESGAELKVTYYSDPFCSTGYIKKESLDLSTYSCYDTNNAPFDLFIPSTGYDVFGTITCAPTDEKDNDDPTDTSSGSEGLTEGETAAVVVGTVAGVSAVAAIGYASYTGAFFTKSAVSASLTTSLVQPGAASSSAAGLGAL